MKYFEVLGSIRKGKERKMNRAEQTHESFHFKKRGEAKIVRLTSQNNEETANAWDRTEPN